MAGIGTLREQHLHATLKEWYRRADDATEVGVDRFVIDVRRASDELVEIQTRGFSSLRTKLDTLLDDHAIRLVHPIAVEKWIRKETARGELVSRRKSPKRGIAADVCAELVAFPTLLSHPNFTLEVALVQEEEVRRPDATDWRRKGWRPLERRLVDVVELLELRAPRDLLAFLPGGLPDPFTTADLAKGLRRTRHLARAVAYCLREAGVLRQVGRGRRGYRYRRPPAV